MAISTVFAPLKPAEVWTLPATVGPDVAVIGINDQPGITATGTADYTKSETVGPFTISGIPAGGASLKGAKDCSVYVDGTFEHAVTGGLTTTPQNTLVYAVVSGGAVTSLTLTASTNKLFGKVNYSQDYVRVAGTLPVQIGANL